jgi:hypothetical protein
MRSAACGQDFFWRRVMKKVWCKLAICEQDVALEVTGYQSSEIEIVI